MTTLGNPRERFEAEARRAMEKSAPEIEILARAGYAARGMVYALVGLFGLLAAIGSPSGRVTDARGVLRLLLDEPFGQVLLGAVALGFLGHAQWRLVQAVFDPERIGRDRRGIAIRIAHAFAGIIHLGFAAIAVQILVGAARARHGPGGSGADALHDWTAWLMSFPLGVIAVAGIGAGVTGFGVQQIARALRGRLDRHLSLKSMPEQARRTTGYICLFGIGSRGVVFAIIGLFLLIAAWHTDPTEAKGLGDALRAVQHRPYGPWLLGVVATGLIAYAIYEFLRATYRQIHIDVE